MVQRNPSITIIIKSSTSTPILYHPSSLSSVAIMASITNIEDDNISETSSLTTALSGQTPTDLFGSDPTLEALFKIQTETEYAIVLGTIPPENRVKIKGVEYIIYEPYEARRSKKLAWYWLNHGVELIRATSG